MSIMICCMGWVHTFPSTDHLSRFDWSEFSHSVEIGVLERNAFIRSYPIESDHREPKASIATYTT